MRALVIFAILVSTLPSSVICFAAENKYAKEVLAVLDKGRSLSQVAHNTDSLTRVVVSIRVKSGEEAGELADRSTEKYGTGVLIAPNLVLTNNHVVNSRDEARRSIVLQNYRMAKHSAETGDPINVLTVKTDPDGVFYTSCSVDFTIFEIESLPNSNMTFALGHDVFARYSLPLSMLSYPLGQPMIRIVNSKCQYPGLASADDIESASKEHGFSVDEARLYHLCNSYPGSSGSPVFDANGTLLGIHRETYYDTTTGIADMNAAVSYAAIVDALHSQHDDAESCDGDANTKLESGIKHEVEWGIESILLNLPPGHEILTKSAIMKMQSAFLSSKTIEDAMINGNISVDYPTYWGFLPNIIELASSHFGKNQYQHAMLVDLNESDPRSRLEVNTRLILQYIEKNVDQFLALENIDREEAARSIGRILHTIQDGYSLAHTFRTANGIREYYYYNGENRKSHAHQDLVQDTYTGELKSNARIAVEETTNLLEAAYTTPPGGRKHAMLAVINHVFRLDFGDNATAARKGSQPAAHYFLSGLEYRSNEKVAFLQPQELSLPSEESGSVEDNGFHSLVQFRVERPIDCCPPDDESP